MKNYKHLFDVEIKRLQHAVAVNPDNEDNQFMLKFMQDAADMDIDKLSSELKRCIESWPCVKTVLIMTIWLLLRDNERRSKQTL